MKWWVGSHKTAFIRDIDKCIQLQIFKDLKVCGLPVITHIKLAWQDFHRIGIQALQFL